MIWFSPSELSFRRRRFLTIGMFVVLFGLAGCGSENIPTEQDKALKAKPKTPKTEAKERWDSIFLDGIRAGYIHTTITSKEEEGRQLVHVSQKLQQIMSRFGHRFETVMHVRSVETPDGELIRFDVFGKLGSQPIQMSGKAADGQMHVESVVNGKQQKHSISWSAGMRGPFGVEQSLQRRPMQPGEKRRIKTMQPSFQSVVIMTVQLVAADYEMTNLPGGEVELLRIDAMISINGQGSVSQVIWTDRQGRVVKTSTPATRQITYKSTEQEATEPPQDPLYDIGLAMSVEISGPARGLGEGRVARYRVKLRDKNPVDVFASGPSQQVAPLKGVPHTAEIIVRAIRPSTPGVVDASRPSADDLQPNRFIQSDDELVVAMARKIAPNVSDPWEIAKALESQVKQSIKNVNFSIALATAAEVARQLEGDCTEHAMLLTALARARRIPARVAIGLVYNGKRQFAFHMWTEVYIAGRWVALDATRGKGGIGVGYLKLIHSNLKGKDSVGASIWRVAEVMDQFAKLEVLKVE